MLNTNIMVISVICTYFIGNLSPSIILSKIYYKRDIREYGSGNAGTTNVLRVMGKKFGAIVFLLDVIKGMLPTYLALRYGGLEMAFLCGVVVVVGHVFPILHGFKGGKGVATSFGAALVLNPFFALISLAIFAIIVLVTRYVSLGSMIGTCVFPLLMFTHSTSKSIKVYSLAFAIIVVFSHRKNIKKLLKGTENKLGKRTKE